jgi:glycerophosphoryl diester phosphodiesterase
MTSNRIIAHRGAWKKLDLPQNSLSALMQAFQLNCYGTEFDLHLTSDNEIIVNHDHDLMGIPIETSTFQMLQSKKLKNGESISKLKDFITTGLKHQKTMLILEVKPSEINKERTLLLAKKTMDLVIEMKAQHLVKYISFDYDACLLLLKTDANAKVSYLNGDKTPEQLKEAAFYGINYHFTVFQQHPEWLSKAKELNLIINCWTVNDIEIARWLLNLKADYITTNEPELFLNQLY